MHIDPITVKAVIFDLNGTLVRDRALHEQTFLEMFSRQGVELSDEEYEAKVTNHLEREIWPDVLARPLSKDDIKKLSEERALRYQRLLEAAQAGTPGATELITALKSYGVRTALATTSTSRQVEVTLETLGLLDAFDVTVTSEEVTRPKPDPEVYIMTLDRLELQPEEVVVFEDSPRGVTASLAVGLRTVGVLPEYSKEVLSSHGVQDFITDFTEVVVG